MNNIAIYDSAENYFEGADDMKNEVLMWFVAGGLMMQELSKKIGHMPYGGLKGSVGYDEHQALRTVSVLDLCSGPGTFVNHLALVYPNIDAVCVDANPTFINAGKVAFKKWKFVEGDVTKIDLGKKFDFVTASSAYHHVPDDRKADFLKNAAKHLADDGSVIVCENFLPDYHSDAERKDAINAYYDEIDAWYREGNATSGAAKIMKYVRQSELRGEAEDGDPCIKVSYRVFKDHVAESGLRIDTDIPVWQTSVLMPSNAGSHVIILVKNDTAR